MAVLIQAHATCAGCGATIASGYYDADNVSEAVSELECHGWTLEHWSEEGMVYFECCEKCPVDEAAKKVASVAMIEASNV